MKYAKKKTEPVYCPRCHKALRRGKDGRLKFRPVDIEEREFVAMVHLKCVKPYEKAS